MAEYLQVFNGNGGLTPADLAQDPEVRKAVRESMTGEELCELILTEILDFNGWDWVTFGRSSDGKVVITDYPDTEAPHE